MWRERLNKLAPYLIGSYFIAFLQWALSPFIVNRWAGVWFARPGVFYFLLIVGLAIGWLIVVIRGFMRCGWLGLAMLIVAPLGLLPFWYYAPIIWLTVGCAITGVCL